MLLKTKKGFIFTIFTAFSILFAIYHAFASPSYVTLISLQPNSSDSDVNITLISNTDQCLIDCEAVLDIYIPDKIGKVKLSELENLNFINEKRTELEKRDLKNLDVDDKNHLQADEFNLWFLKTKSSNNLRDFRIEKNINGAWKSFDLNEGFDAGHNIIKISGVKQPKIGENSIDWRISLNLSGNYTEPDFAWWGSSWTYRTKINITNNNATLNLTNHQINISINTTKLYNENKIQQYCNDTRFTYYNSTSQQETEISHWTEICNTSGGNSTFWINVTYVAPGGNATIYFYYGNPSASSTSNYTNTFEPIPIYVIEDNSTSPYAAKLSKVTMQSGIVSSTTFNQRVLQWSIDLDRNRGYIYIAAYDNSQTYNISTANNVFGAFQQLAGGNPGQDMGMDYSEKYDQYFVGSYSGNGSSESWVLRYNRDGTNGVGYYVGGLETWPRSVFFCEADNKLYVARDGTSGMDLVRINYDTTGLQTGLSLNKISAPIYVHSDGNVSWSNSTNQIVKTNFTGGNPVGLNNLSAYLAQDFDYDPNSGYYYILDTRASPDRIIKTKLDGTGWTTVNLDSDIYTGITWGFRNFAFPKPTYAIFSEEEQPPNVTLVSPANASNDTDGNLTFICNATDNIGIQNVSLWGNWSGSGWHRNQTYDENQTLQLDYTYDVADVHTGYAEGENYNEIQMKWDISSIPKNATITNATLCMYVNYSSSNDKDANFSRVNNQTWDEGISASAYNSLPETNITQNYNWSSNVTDTWSCINISNALLTDYNLGNNYTSFRIEDLDYPVSSATVITESDKLWFGYYGSGDFPGSARSISFNSRTFSDTSRRPYINITYSFSNVTTVKFNVTGLSDGDYKWNCRAFDIAGNYDWGGQSDANWTFRVNLPPTVAYVNITPSVAYTNDSLNCRFNITDADPGDSLSVNVTWYRDNNNGSGFLPWSQDNENSLAVSNWMFNDTTALGDVEANKTYHNDKWICSVNAFDGLSWSGWSNSSERTISSYTTSLNITNETGKVTGQLVLFTANYSSNKTGDIGRVVWKSSQLVNPAAEGAAFSSAFVDLNNDGKKDDFVVGANYGSEAQLYAFYANKTQKWNVTSWTVVYEIKAGDLDNDGYENDIAVEGYYDSGPGLRVYNESGDDVWQGTGYNDYHVVDIGYIDDDSMLDVVGTTAEGNITAYKGNGSFLWEANNQTGTYLGGIREIAVGNLSEGRVVVPYEINEDGVFVYNSTGKVQWNASNTIMMPRTVGLINLDSDPYDEVLIGGYEGGGTILAYDHNGSYLWNVTPGIGNTYEIAVGDLNNDGYDEFVFHEGYGPGNGYIYAYNRSGSQLWNYSLTNASDGVIINNLRIADVNDDGNPEIMATGQSSNKTYLLNSTGSLVFDYDAGSNIGMDLLFGSSASMDVSDNNDDYINDIGVIALNGYAHIIQDVNCIIQFNDSVSANMTWNQTSGLWDYNRTFNYNGIYDWNVTCSKSGYDASAQNSAVNITFKPIPHSIQIELILNNTNAKVYIPGVGEYNISILPNNTYANPSHYYLASYLNNLLIGLVYSMQNPLSVSTNSSGTNYTLGLNQSLDNSMAFLVFTKNDGSGWKIIDKRMDLIETGKFLTQISPSFSFGLGYLHPIMIILKYADIEIVGDKSIFRKGTRDVVLENNGTVNNKPSVYIEET